MRRRTAAAAQGFTLVEVLVALFVMALMAALAWRGLDGVLKSRDISRDAVDRTALMATLMSQWETDLLAIQADTGVPSLAFDGRTLRLTRRHEGGVQVVAWSLNGSTWQRWASPAVTRLGELQDAWLRSQQLQGPEPEQVRLLEGVSEWQVYFYRGNAWTNAQSTGDVTPAPESATAAANAAASAPARTVEQLPSGVRLVLQIDGRALTRDLAIVSGT